jgi:molybdopterin molybdotransferase
VKVRPGFPMLLARLPDKTFVAGLPGNPQSAVVALMSLVVPLLAGLRGQPLPELAQARLAAAVGGRGDYTHLALVDASMRPVRHVGSAMLRGVASAYGFAVVRPGHNGEAGEVVDVLRLPLVAS